jgi:small-conductance mechanosensitive channel
LAASYELLTLLTRWLLALAGRPPVEAEMLRRVYRMAAFAGALAVLAFGLGKLATFGGLLTLFGGMFLGWSLQAPVSGVAAWVLVLLKRPFRPGDRVQFPELGITGDVKDVGAMYVTLDQVGGAIASEEPVGRNVLVPNAMLFGQVIINYTVEQEAAYMLDEVVIRITYDSNWDVAEAILLNAAREVTGDVIATTGRQPYIRSELYDYGVYLRLRYQTRVKDRAETAYRLEKRIFDDVQKTPAVDMAIPYVYSYRSVTDGRTEELASAADAQEIREVDLDRIETDVFHLDPRDVESVARTVQAQGLLQPIVVSKLPQGGKYRLVAGRMRFEACRRLGWKTIPAIVREAREGAAVP